jgi:hypothetical protein
MGGILIIALTFTQPGYFDKKKAFCRNDTVAIITLMTVITFSDLGGNRR